QAPAADPSTTVTAAPSSSTTTGQAPAASASASNGEAPAALAQRAVLAQADLPTGFTMTSPGPPDAPAAGESPFERCAGADAAGLTRSIGGRARSATFARA